MANVALYLHECEDEERRRKRRNRSKAMFAAGVLLFVLATYRKPPTPPQAVRTEIKVIEVAQPATTVIYQSLEPFGPPPPSRATVTPNAFAFGAQRAGSGTAARLVTVVNGGGHPLDVGVSLAGDGFAMTNACPPTLAARSQCAIAMVFQPRRAGAHRATLTINADTTQRVSLTGAGIEASVPPRIIETTTIVPAPPPPPVELPPPAPAPKPAIVEPADIIFYSAGRERVKITNPNAAPLRITAIDILGGTPDGYKIPDRNRCLTTLAPHASCEITILALQRAISRRQTIRIRVSSQ